MTLRLSLPPDLETRLKSAASKNGKPVEQYAVQVLEEHVPPTATNQAAAQMLLRWAQDDEAMTDAEAAENEAILRAIDADRLSDRKLFNYLLPENES
jgi:predicted DNA-binding protein